MTDAQVIQRSTLLSSGKTIGGSYGWGHELFKYCQCGSFLLGDAQILHKMSHDVQAFPNAWKVWYICISENECRQ